MGHGFPVSHHRTLHTFSTFLRAFTVGDHVQSQLIGILPLLTFLRAFIAGDHVQPQLIGIFPLLTFLRAFTANDHVQSQLIGILPFLTFCGLSLLVIMSNRECRVFHPGGEGNLPQLAMPNIHVFHFFF